MSEDYIVRVLDFSFGQLIINQTFIGDVGCVVWDAAIVLAKFIDGPFFKEMHSFKDCFFLELGTGTGLLGLTAAALGYFSSFYTMKCELIETLKRFRNTYCYVFKLMHIKRDFFLFSSLSFRGNVTLTDLENLIPLVQKNIQCNKNALKGECSAMVLKWYAHILL